MLLQALLLQLKFDDGDDDHDHHHGDDGGDGDDDDDDDDDDMKYEWVQNPPEATPTTHFLCQEARFSSECQYYYYYYYYYYKSHIKYLSVNIKAFTSCIIMILIMSPTSSLLNSSFAPFGRSSSRVTLACPPSITG